MHTQRVRPMGAVGNAVEVIERSMGPVLPSRCLPVLILLPPVRNGAAVEGIDRLLKPAHPSKYLQMAI